MAVKSVRRLFTGRSTTQGLDARVTTSDVWEVIVDDALADGEQEVGNAVDPDDPTKAIPRIGSNHVNVTKAVAVSVDPECSDDSPYIWYVTVKYDTNPDIKSPNAIDSQGNPAPGEGPQKQSDKPTDRPAKWKIGSVDVEEVVREWIPVKPSGEVDFITPPNWFAGVAYKRGQYVVSNGNVYWCLFPGTSAVAPAGTGDAQNFIFDGADLSWQYLSTLLQATKDPRFAILVAVLNSGKCPFDPPLMTTVSYPTVIVTMNLPAAVVSVGYCAQQKNAVNVKTWKGMPPRTCKILRTDAGNESDNGENYCSFTWEIGLNLDTWDSRALDAGFGGIGLVTKPNPLYPAAGEPKTKQVREFYPFKVGSEDVTEAVPMDGKGGRLDPDADPVILRGIPKQQKLIDFSEYIPW